MNPYVVSRDIRLLLTKWGQKQGFTIPEEAINKARNDIDLELRSIFPNVETVGEEELSDGMLALSQKQGLTVISLDRVYTQTRFYLDLTRAVDTNLKDVGLANRDTNSSPEAQVKKLAETLQEENISHVTLVDDVIFSGSMMLWLIQQLHIHGVQVESIVAGVMIGEGQDCLKREKINLQAVYNFETVVDEICERDFFPGVPFSGRTVVGEKKYGAPYLLPFGLPGKWASIPPNREHHFSQVCLQASIELFEAISEASKQQVLCTHLEKIPLGCSHKPISFVQELKKIATTLES